MTTNEIEHKNGRNLRALLPFGLKQRHITGYHVGDIHAPEHIIISQGATVVGDVIAPRVTIAGLLYGSIVAHKAQIQRGGQIWGDVYATDLRLKSGGKLNGWISTID
ncbi:MAG: polymer-forming cytoskeletal protein, partial [Chloroflexi bacterium]